MLAALRKSRHREREDWCYYSSKTPSDRHLLCNVDRAGTAAFRKGTLGAASRSYVGLGGWPHLHAWEQPRSG
jgi:hypothetical protein